ncbi:MAG: hypothetical protein QOE34_305 [Verrucomicrobiota bacterium]|jgi:hypothetical protein
MNTATSTSISRLEPAQHTAAKLAGFLYLFTNTTAIVAFSARGKLMVPHDAVQTARNIASSEQLFRIGIAFELITVVGVIILLWALYVILKPINKDVALLGAFLRLAENFVLAFITVHEFAVLAVLKGSPSLRAFGTPQLQGLADTFVRLYGDTFNIGFLFLGLGSAVFSYLWVKSRYIPRVLAAWGIFASLVMALMSLALIVLPGLSAMGMTYMMPMGLYEFGLGFWLLLKGIKAAPVAA